MGCASSAPLVEQGKSLVEGVKDTANETMVKGERALQNTTDTIKDGIDSVKDSMQTVINTAEESVGSVAQKIGDTFAFTTSRTSENLKDANELLSPSKDDLLTTASDAAMEAVSEAETVVMSETEQAKEAFQTAAAPFFETVHSLEGDVVDGALRDLEVVEKPMEEAVLKGTEVLEDLEVDSNKELLGETVGAAKESVEELHDLAIGEAKDKEEPPPTFWEAAADAILIKKVIKGLETASPFRPKQRILFTPSEKPDSDLSGKHSRDDDLVVENADN